MDQLVLSLLLSTLTEESMSVVVGLSTSRDVWFRLETTFSHKSKSRELRLRDELQTMKKHDKSLSDFSREFKALCDNLPQWAVQLTTMTKSIGFFIVLVLPSQ